MTMITLTHLIVSLILLSVNPSETTPLLAAKPSTRDQSLSCYSCSCANTTCPCTEYETKPAESTYCVIVRENFGQSVFIDLEHLDITSTRIYIAEFPYVLVEESITYDERVTRWYTTTNFIIYGCNWNLCNKPELIPLLPNSFQMRLPEAWLNTNILGSGQPVRDCHQCPDAPVCGTTEFIDASRCPVQACNTTCLVSDTVNDPAYDYFCYQSFCGPTDQDGYEIDRHTVEIEGIVYANDPSVVELWEIDLFCRADDCSRPEIFKELREALYVQVDSLATLFTETHDPAIPQRRCYDCYCFSGFDCVCNKTRIMPANTTYCVIVREDYGQLSWLVLEHINQDSTRVNIQDFPYLIVDESIVYNEQTTQWNTFTNLVIYGCNWDYCNHPSLIATLPRTFQMRLPEPWLNTNVLGTGQPVRECHECPDAPQCGTTDFLDATRCPIRSCNTTCLVFDTFNNPADDLQCYQSLCAPADSENYEIDRHRVEIEGILYFKRQPREVELWEIDLYCRADDCSRPEIFTELRSQLSLTIGDLSAFESQIVTSTSTQPGITQTAPPSLGTSIFTTFNFVSIALVVMLLFKPY